MGLRKHGEGSVLGGEDIQKTSSTESDEERQQRLADLHQENTEEDQQ